MKEINQQKEQGVCALCLESAMLESSHLMPKFAYKFLANTESKYSDKKISPIIIQKNKALSTNYQFTYKLLCKKCEDNFSSSETYFSKLVHNKYVDLFDESDLTLSSENLMRINEDIKINELIRFSISIFWRSYAMSQGVELSTHFAEAFRNYLLKGIALPSNIVIFLTRNTKCEIDLNNLFTFPISDENDPQMHDFSLLGVSFVMFTGDKIPLDYYAFSLVNCTNQFRLVVKHSTISLDSARNMAVSAEIKGNSLKKQIQLSASKRKR